MRQVSIILICIMFSLNVFSQGNITGIWNTIDDDTGEQKSTVEILIKDGKLYGKIISLANEKDADATCTECTDYRKGRKVVGMQIISGLIKSGNSWIGDDGILDPANGKLYDVKIWEENGYLKVRGYIGFIYRTQTWIRNK